MRAFSSPPAPRLLHYAPTHDALDLLDAAGVKTFTDLAQWDALRLQHRLAQVNAAARRVGDAPPVATVASWIAHARRSTRAADRQARRPAPFARLRRLYARLAAR
jgi:hypothetical protein